MKYFTPDGNQIVAGEEFMAAQYPSGGYSEIPDNAPPPPVWYTLADFYRLFGIMKHAAIIEASKTDSVIAAFMQLLQAAGGCYLDAAETVQGVGYLQSVNLLTEAEAAAVLAGSGIA